jgi:hypothetical protein
MAPNISPCAASTWLADLAQGTVCKILDREAVKPHKVRYYLEQRDPDFATRSSIFDSTGPFRLSALSESIPSGPLGRHPELE